MTFENKWVPTQGIRAGDWADERAHKLCEGALYIDVEAVARALRQAKEDGKGCGFSKPTQGELIP